MKQKIITFIFGERRKGEPVSKKPTFKTFQPATPVGWNEWAQELQISSRAPKTQYFSQS